MGAGALWGVVFLAPKLAGEFSPLQITVGRYLAYGAISAGLIAPRWRELFGRLGRREWLGLAWLSLFGNAFYYAMVATGVQLAGVAVTALIIGFLPVTVTIAGSRDHGAAPLRQLAPSLLLGAAGVICISWRALASSSAGAGPMPVAGIACAVCALGSWTAYAVGNSRWLARRPDISAHDWNLLIGLMTGAQSLALIPVAVLTGEIRHDLAAWSKLAGVSIAMAVLASILASMLWNRMSRMLPLTLAGQMILFETLFALIYGFVWERRLPSVLEVAAFALVVLSVATCIAVHSRQSTKVEAEAAA